MNGVSRQALSNPSLPRKGLRALQNARGLRQPLAVRGTAKWCQEHPRGGASPGNPRVASKNDDHQTRPIPRGFPRAGDDPQRGVVGADVELSWAVALSRARSRANSARMRRFNTVSFCTSWTAWLSDLRQASATPWSNPLPMAIRRVAIWRHSRHIGMTGNAFVESSRLARSHI